MTAREQVLIDEWDATHPQWPALMQVIAAHGQSDWVAFHAAFHQSSHLLVAQQGEQIVGFLRFVIQEIGPDADCPAVLLDGVVLTEAKVLAFAVDPAHQQRGIGRALQEALLRAAKARGCYQVRSHSSGDHTANHHLKLAMGFGIHPINRGADNQGVYFVMPLRADRFDVISSDR